MIFKNGDKIAIVACSNAQPLSNKTKVEKLIKVISEIGLIPVCSDFIFEKYSVFSGSPEERAKEFSPKLELTSPEIVVKR